MSAGPGRPPAVVLCGGTSRRMGRDKALVEFHGVPLVARMYGALESLFPDVVLSVSGVEQEKAVRAVLQGGIASARMARYIPDAERDRGPLEGVRSSLQELDVEYAFFVAVDMPNVPARVINTLWETVRDSGCRGAVPTWDGQIEPACAFYSQQLLPEIEAALARGERSLRQLVEWDGVLRVPVPATSLEFASINTPEDLERTEKLLDKRQKESDP